MTPNEPTPDARMLDERTLQDLLYNPFSDEVREDPYPVYKRLRQTHPFYWHPAGFWIASRWADCDAILRDKRFLTVNPHAWQGQLRIQAAPEDTRVLQTELRRTMLFAAPKEHQRVRGPLNRAFAPKVIEEKRHRVRAVADRLIDAFPETGRFDFMDAFASPFPILVMADLLGVPPGDQQQLADWSRTISPILDPVQTPEAVAAASRTIREFHAYMRGLLAERAKRPRNDLLSLMQEPDEDGTLLTEDELVANVGFLLAAGHGTATHLMGNGLWILLRNPDAWRRLNTEPRLFGTLTDEILRYEAPAQMTMREPTENVLVGGRLVQAGRRVLVLIGSANRDPTVFPSPDAFDPGRRPNEHLAFSAGPHFCLGAALARVEGQEAFGALVERASDLRLAAPVGEWQHTITMRGFRHLPVVRG